MIQQIPIKQSTYHKAVLKMLSAFPPLNITDYEMDIIASMLKTDNTILNKVSRKQIKESLNKDTFTFNNYIKRLKDRGLLVKTDLGLELHSNLKDCFNSNEFTFKFNLISETP